MKRKLEQLLRALTRELAAELISFAKGAVVIVILSIALGTAWLGLGFALIVAGVDIATRSLILGGAGAGLLAMLVVVLMLAAAIDGLPETSSG